MSEKIQHTATGTREKMRARYGDELHHKHNKSHLNYRLHCRSHPIVTTSVNDGSDFNHSTGLIREFKLRKIRKRLDKGRIH